MRILILTHFFPPEMGGAASRLFGLARHLRQFGHQVTVLTGFPNYPSGVFPDAYQRRWITHETIEDIEVIRIRVYASPRRGSIRRLANYMSYIAMSTFVGMQRRQTYDIVFASSPPLFIGLAGVALARKMNVPWVFDIRDLWPDVAVEAGEFAPDSAMTTVWNLLADQLYRWATHVTPVTNNKLQKLLAKGVPAHKLTLVSNGVDLDLVSCPDENQKQAFGLADKFVILYAGLIGIGQGVEAIVPAAQQLQSHPDLHFLVVGDGARSNELKTQVETLGLTNVTLLPQQPRESMPKLMAAADLCFVPLVSSKLDDAVPSKLLEAWAYRKPVLLMAGGEAAQLVRQCDGGQIAAPEQPNALASFLERMVSDPLRLEEQGAQGRRLIEQYFDRQALARQMESVFSRVITQSLSNGTSAQKVAFSLLRRLPLAVRSTALTAGRAGFKRTARRAQRQLNLRVINRISAQYRFRQRHFATIDLPAVTPAQRMLLQQLAAIRLTSTTSRAWNYDAGELVLLNQAPQPLRTAGDWSAHVLADPLYAFELHGWQWLWGAILDQQAQATIESRMTEWLHEFAIGQRPAWEPYPTSRRLVAWLAAAACASNMQFFMSALVQHVEYLLDQVEYDLSNNHVIANAKAIAWTGLLLPQQVGSGRWQKTGLTILWDALRNQVRDDGGHVENSPYYHLTVLVDCLETALLCTVTGVAVPEDVSVKLGAMWRFLLALQRPDNKLPLTNDGIADEPLSMAACTLLVKMWNAQQPSQLMTEIPDRCSIALPDTGYAVLRAKSAAKETYLFFDAGELGPRYCPGHGHADLLSIELWYGTQPLIIDPGTYQYAAGQWREYFRSTKAHSTATVDNLDQVEFAGPFRIGELACGKLLQVKLNQQRQELAGVHTGYLRLSDPVTHERRVVVDGSRQIEITDSFFGDTEHEIDLRLHLATLAVRINGSSVIADYPDGTKLVIDFQPPKLSRQIVSIEEAWCSPSWRQKDSTSIVLFSFRHKLPVSISTSLKII